MIIPDKIRIAGVEYYTEFEKSLNNGDRLCYGRCMFEECKIKLLDDMNIDHQHRCQTYLHEILHAIQKHYNVPVPEQSHEDIINGFATGLYQVITENAPELFNVTEATDET